MNEQQNNTASNDANSNVTNVIDITPAAKFEIKRRIQNDERKEIGLRLGVKGGGCSGLSYIIKVDDPQPDDKVIAEEGFNIYIDKKSSLYLKDTLLDYESNFMGGGFKFKNPNATNTCGCGSSFSV